MVRVSPSLTMTLEPPGTLNCCYGHVSHLLWLMTLASGLSGGQPVSGRLIL